MTATPADAAASDSTATDAPLSSAPSTRFDPSAPVPEEYDVFCHACGYSLVGLAGDRCPECGAAFNPSDLPYARVPWLHRRRIGRVRAYWQTVRQVAWRPTAFAGELCRPVRISADDARRFRSTTAYVAATAITAAIGALAYANTTFWKWQDALGFVLAMALGLGATVFFLRLATDMPVFIWRGLPSLPPNELAPLHHYAAAPLAYAPLVVAVVLGLWTLSAFVNAPRWFYYPVGAASVALVAGWMLLCWWTPLALMRGATGCGPRRVMILGAYLPAHALMMLVLSFLLFMLCMIPCIQFIDYLERHF
jgi:hypothetical protein